MMDRDIAMAIHYPECWDTMAYPTLASALWEMVSTKGTDDFEFECNEEMCCYE